MKHLYWIIPCMILCGCLSDENIPETREDITITGNQFYSFSSPESRLVTVNELPQGARASFFSTGGIEAHHETVIYNPPHWQHHLKWNQTQANADIHVYYPEFPQTADGFYESSGELKDYLKCQQKVEYKSNITLSFQHIFSLLSVEVHKRVNRKISSITITPSAKVTEIDPYNGTITCSQEAHNQEYALSSTANGIYQFVIPPASNMGITLKISYKDKTEKILHIEPRDYQANTRYRCRLVSQNQEAGIYTAEDFIAFTHLYNGMPYEDRSLEEFGITENGVTTYYLHNDIHFTKEESAKVKDIGYLDRKLKGTGFKDVFDGQGNTLYDLDLQIQDSAKNDKYCLGIFNWVTKTGKIENLNIVNAQIRYKNFYNIYSDKIVGVVAGNNEGVINNCHINNCRIYIYITGYAGGCSGNNAGTIINCGVDSLTVIPQDPKRKVHGGGISNYNRGNIINCYSAFCDFSALESSGGISQIVDGSKTINCYVYLSKYKSLKKYADITYLIYSSSSIQNCYYHTQCTTSKKTESIRNTLKYDIKTLQVNKGNGKKEPLKDCLNRWITENGAQTYPQYQFLPWTEGKNPPIVLQSPWD